MNSIGQFFRITLYGESHQAAIGVVIDGVPPGLEIDLESIERDLKRRNPDAVGTTPRKEKDAFVITAGVFNGKTTGSPVHVTIPNTDVRSKDYTALKDHPRPGHSDFVAHEKYGGFNDYRGGGRFSGRLTAPLVVAGSIAKQIVPFSFSSRIKQLGSLTDLSRMDDYLKSIQDDGDSIGGIVEVSVDNIPVGLGEPMFEKVEAKIGQMLFSVPAVKGVEFGTGFSGVDMKGSEFNDVIEAATGKTRTNHSGGISGGITNGNPLVVSVFVKPTASIKKAQKTYNRNTQDMRTLEVNGRHDVAIVRRAPVVLENLVAIALVDLYISQEANKACLEITR